MIGCARAFVVLTLAMSVAGCVHGADSQTPCINSASGSLFVTVTNASDVPIAVPRDQPHIGCCNTASLSIAVTDANGVEIKRCGTSDNFDVPAEVRLRPSEFIRYELSEVSMRGGYCGVDLTKYFIKASFGRSDSPRFRIAPNVEPIQECPRSPRIKSVSGSE